MNKKKTGQSPFSVLKGHLLSLLLFVAIFVMFIWGLNSASSNSNIEEQKILKESIQRAVVSCYAIEGRYPDSIKYLEKNYGVKIDTNKYYVDYQIFGSNIMPEIHVIANDDQEGQS